MLSTLRRGSIIHIENSFIENDEEPVEPIQTTTPEIATEMKKHYIAHGNLDKFKQNELREALKYYKSTINFQKNSSILHRKYSASDQKKIKTQYDFSASGKKQNFIDRILGFYVKEKACIKIQRRFRGILVRECMRLRGPGLKDKKLCVNDTDFYTFDKLRDIDISDFFSYKCDDFIYGFRLSSVIILFKNKTKKILNPYTRKPMDHVLQNIEKLSRFTKIIHKNIPSEIDEFVSDKITTRSNAPRVIYNRESTLTRTQSNNTLNLQTEYGYNYNEMTEKMTQIRQQPMQTRIIQLFMEIDHLGNYTDPAWFLGLDRTQYVRYYRCLYDIWSYRGQLPPDVKNKICPLGNPFLNTTQNFSVYGYNSIEDAEIQKMCIHIMENMVYTGVNTEFKVIGAFQVLCALTVVSSSARRAIPWLYESVAY
jgi:hypothetical protein